MEPYSVGTIYTCILVSGYKIVYVNEIHTNTFLVTMKKGIDVTSVLLKPREQNE